MPFKFYMSRIILLLSLVLIAVSCKKDSELQKNIAKINTDIKVERFDRLFAEVTSEELPKLKETYACMFSQKY